jgi:hypothetical protein
MGVTSELRAEIERVFVPWLVARGFAVARRQLPFVLAFRRERREWCELVELQWEKYGRPRFVLNFARAPAQGLEIGGKHFAVAELCAGWVPGNGRLQPGRGGTSASWFRQDRGFSHGPSAAERSCPRVRSSRA